MRTGLGLCVLPAAALVLMLASGQGCPGNAGGLPLLDVIGAGDQVAGFTPEVADAPAAPETIAGDESTVVDPGSDAALAPQSIVAEPEPLPVNDEGPYVSGRVLVKFRNEVAEIHRRNILNEEDLTEEGAINAIDVKILQLPAQANERAVLNALRNRPQIEFAELDHIVPHSAVPNDPSYGSQWHLAKIAAPTAWDTTTGSPGVIIAIIDSGCDPTHPDLASKYVAGWNIFNNNSDTSDVFGHGTAVAGTAAAAANNGIGLASVAWNCPIMPVRASDVDGSAYVSDLASGLTWAADHGARVANISFSVTDYSTVTSAAQYFKTKGGVVTISAGNSATFDATADNPDVLTVSATDSNDVLTSWSCTGNNVDLAAPGVSIYTTSRGGGYGGWSGTSFSAPMVAGVAALVISANPGLSTNQVHSILQQTADDRGTVGWDTSYGWGRVNAARAVALALATPTAAADTTPPTVAIAAPVAGSSVLGTVSVQVNAADNIGVASVSLSVDGGTATSDTTSPYTFSWSTTSTANGTHSLTATAKDEAGKVSSTTVQVLVSNPVDTTPPAIAITSPLAGATVSNTVSVTVNATDNIAVTKVDLYVDGVLTATSTTAPFTTKWNAKRAKTGSHTLQCKAYDAAGNSSTSAGVIVKK